MTNRNDRSIFNYWRPTELAALVVGLIVFWPLGVAVLVWKYWNDRSSVPRNLDSIVCEGVRNLRTNLRDIFGSAPSRNTAGEDTASAFADDLAPTGNAAFDAHIRDELLHIDARRRKLAEEVRAFRAFLDEERAGGPEVYERFRHRRDSGPHSI